MQLVGSCVIAQLPAMSFANCQLWGKLKTCMSAKQRLCMMNDILLYLLCWPLCDIVCSRGDVRVKERNVEAKEMG